MPAIPHILRRALAFGVVSGAGLAIDIVLFIALVRWGAEPGWANLASATVAVGFVFFTSVHRVFSYRGGFLLGLFLIYLTYQAAAVFAASVAVGALARHLTPVLAKLAVLPATFGANFAFMSLLTRSARARTPSSEVGGRHG